MANRLSSFMIEINWSRCTTTPFDHQKAGVRELVLPTNSKSGRLIKGVFALFDQVGAGKSKQVVDGSQILFEAGELDTVLVLTPGFARSVWQDPDPVLGEVAKHAWADVPNVIHEYHERTPTIAWEPKALNWVVSNYEFIRVPSRLAKLQAQLKGRKIWIVCDEAWALKNIKAKQTKAVLKLRALASRATILNGTPGLPMDLFSQFYILDPRIIGMKNFFFFRARYAIMGGFQNKAIVGYQNLEELQAKTKPYALQRLTRECWDLPPIMPPVLIEARLKDSTWAPYKAMRDEMVAWLSATEASTASQAIVKGLRLAQITSGFLGGVEKQFDQGDFDYRDGPITSFVDVTCMGDSNIQIAAIRNSIREIGREKLDAVLDWLSNNPRPDKLLIWCRFRAELERAAEALTAHYTVFKLYGGQSPEDRNAAKRALAPETTFDYPVCVVGNPQAGGAALNLAGASLAITLSNDFSLKTYIQKNGRIDRPGQRNPITFADVVAVGPKGQKTIDHHVLKSLRTNQDLAEWTAAVWRQKLVEE